jgi:hypothetical protein
MHVATTTVNTSTTKAGFSQGERHDLEWLNRLYPNVRRQA